MDAKNSRLGKTLKFAYVKVVSLGIHLVDVHGYPVSEVPPGQGLAMLKQVRFTVAGTAAGTSIDMAKLGLDVSAMGAIHQVELETSSWPRWPRVGVDTTNLVRKSTGSNFMFVAADSTQRRATRSSRYWG